MGILRKWDVLNKEQKKHLLDDIVTQLQALEDEKPGVMAADELLDTIAQKIGPSIYNKGIDDAKKLLDTKLLDMQVDLDLLKTPVI